MYEIQGWIVLTNKKKKELRLWTSISLPVDLLELIDELFKDDEYTKKLYRNRTSFIIDAIRKLIEKFKIDE